MQQPLQLNVSCSNSLNFDAGVAVPVDDDGGVLRQERELHELQLRRFGHFANGNIYNSH